MPLPNRFKHNWEYRAIDAATADGGFAPAGAEPMDTDGGATEHRHGRRAPFRPVERHADDEEDLAGGADLLHDFRGA